MSDTVEINVVENVTVVTIRNFNQDLDDHIIDKENPHEVTKSQIGLGNVPNLSFSGVNSGDETTETIQEKRPLKTVSGQSLEGIGNLNFELQIEDDFFYDENDIFRLNVSTFRQVEIATQNNQTFTLNFEPTFIYFVNVNGIVLNQNQYIYTAPNQLKINSNTIGQTIEIIYDKFTNSI